MVKKTQEELSTMSVEELIQYEAELKEFEKQELEAKLTAEFEEKIKDLKEEYNSNIEEIKGNIQSVKEEQEEASKLTTEAINKNNSQIQNLLKKGSSKGMKDTQKFSTKSFFESNKETFAKVKEYGQAFKVKAPLLLSTFTGTAVPASQIPGITDQVRRRLFLVDIIRQAVMSGTSKEWREQVNRVQASDYTAEGTLKNNGGFDIVSFTKEAAKLTEWIDASTESIDDADYMSDLIDRELRNNLIEKLEDELLNGDGTGANINGLFTLATAFSPIINGQDNTAQVVEANNSDVLDLAIHQVIANNGLATHVLLNPADVYTMDVAKASDGHYVRAPFVNLETMTFKGLPIIVSNGIPVGEYLVGDMTKPTLYTREEVELRKGQKGDDLILNLTTIVGEWRGLMIVPQNHYGSFVKGNFAADKAVLLRP